MIVTFIQILPTVHWSGCFPSRVPKESRSFTEKGTSLSPWWLQFSVCTDVNRLRHLMEIYETINNINYSFMKQIFQLRKINRRVRNQYKLNLSVPKIIQVSLGEKGLRYYGPKIWNSLLFHVKTFSVSCFMFYSCFILKLSKPLLKIWMVVHVTVGCVRVDLN